ncbi:hypothetical protein MRX96_002141 [Rhipicephalus microplus]
MYRVVSGLKYALLQALFSRTCAAAFKGAPRDRTPCVATTDCKRQKLVPVRRQGSKLTLNAHLKTTVHHMNIRKSLRLRRMHTFNLVLCVAASTVLAITNVAARSSGAPSEACATMVPRHGSEDTSRKSRYRLTQNHVNFTEDDIIEGFATHVDGRPKTLVTFLWLPPHRHGAVTFVATVVKDYMTFYTSITSVEVV